jgi:type IV pilus modification protein PilV
MREVTTESMFVRIPIIRMPISMKERGFTLIETLISLLILAFGLLSIASLLSYSIAANFENRTDAVGTSLAVQKMEQVRAQPVSSIADGGCALDASGDIDFSQPAVANYSQVVSGINQQAFEVRWNVSTTNGLRKIAVAARRVVGTRSYMTNILRPVNIKCLKQP